ncbi:hypothetical protein [Lysobacter capsici]|uniref:hypothetical protein n=1 Tax=Lysobacter capsici TaxID=435897 RepID=UPI000B007D15|nr:hypothetical protein [Lysobacter capsici]
MNALAIFVARDADRRFASIKLTATADVKCADRANAHAIADATDSGAAIARGIDRGVRRTDHRYAACDCNSLPHAPMRRHRGSCSTAAAARSKVGGERIAAAGRTRWFAA